MNLPNYFLADLPAEATLTSAMLGEACDTLKRNRERYLAHRSTESLLRLLSGVALSWLDAGSQFRQLALQQGPAATGFSPQTLAAGLDTFFKQLTFENLKTLVHQDLGDAQRLDTFAQNGPEDSGRRAALASGPELLLHITAGNIPNPALMSMVLGVLVRSAQVVKCATGKALLPRLFAHSLYEADSKLGACLEVVEWRGGRADLEQEIFKHAGCVTATGSDETLSAVKLQLTAGTRFLGYGHRVSFAYVDSAILSGLNARRFAARAAADVAAWNQQGCLSPHVIYVRESGLVTAEAFAQLLAEELDRHEAAEPRGELSREEAAAIASRRSVYELRAAHSPETRWWASKGSTAWTVVYEAEPRFQLSCLNRFIYVKPAKALTDALQHADAVKGKVSTVGLAAPEHQAQELATELARWGASRVCPLGQMQNPPLTWRHDGRPALADLVTWTDWEMPA